MLQHWCRCEPAQQHASAALPLAAAGRAHLQVVCGQVVRRRVQRPLQGLPPHLLCQLQGGAGRDLGM